MINSIFEQLSEQLDRQVIHMDQGLAYCPEFRATREMSDYPSRKMEIIRAVAKGYLEPSRRTCEIINNYIFSRQGERWQNFGEDPEEYTQLMIHARNMLLKAGYNQDYAERAKEISQNPDSYWCTNLAEEAEHWNRNLPVKSESTDWLFLNGPVWKYLYEKADSLGRILVKNNISVLPHQHPDSTGWELYTFGLLDEGDSHLAKIIDTLKKAGVRRIITACAQSYWIWTVLMKQRGLKHDFAVVDVADIIHDMKIDSPVPLYIYAGSFYTRYTGKADVLDGIVENQRKYVISSSEEFFPKYAAQRGVVNKVNKWQKPLCPEYLTFGSIEEQILESIYQDSIMDYHSAQAGKLIVCDPYAWNCLKEHAFGADCGYLWELIDLM